MFRSIRVRLTLWYAALLAAFLVLFGLVVYIAAARALHAEVDSELRTEAEAVIARLPSEIPAVRSQVAPRSPDISLTETELMAQVLDINGRAIGKSVRLRGGMLPVVPGQGLPTTEMFLTTRRAGKPLRIYFKPVRRAGRAVSVVEVAEPLETVERALHHLRDILLVGIPATLLLSFLGGLLLAHWTLSPIDRITRAAHAVNATRLGYRIGSDSTKDELGRLAAAFDEMIARLEQSFATQQRFVADASHELRTPLTVMVGHLDVCLRDPAATEQDLRETLVVVRQEVEHMSRTVEALLTLARADAGEEPLAREKVELDALLEQTVGEARMVTGQKHLQLAHVEPLTVEGDTDSLQQLFRNLLDNALKFTPADGLIEVRLTRREDRAVVTVADNGSGIAAEHLPHLFSRFYRVDKARSRELGGAGLGLAIAKWIVARHGGSIKVESRVGMGTTFTVVLPLAAGQRPAISNHNLMKH